MLVYIVRSGRRPQSGQLRSKCQGALSGGRVREEGRLGFRNCKARVEVGIHKALGQAFEHTCLQGDDRESWSPVLVLSRSLPCKPLGRLQVEPQDHKWTADPHWRLIEAEMADI